MTIPTVPTDEPVTKLRRTVAMASETSGLPGTFRIGILNE